MKIKKININNFLINNLSLKETINLVKTEVKTNIKKSFLVFTINLHHLYLLDRNKHFNKIYNQAELIVPDGVFLLWLRLLLKNPLKGRVNGTDLTYALLKVAKENNFKVFFIFAHKYDKKKIKRLKNKGLLFDCFFLPFKKYKDYNLTKKAIKKINSFSPDILFMGLGVLKQEEWLAKNRNKLNVKVALGVGSALDYLVGKRKRAPLWMQRMGLEWLWRFLQEPKRLFKRYFIQDLFFGLKILLSLIYQRLFRGE